MGQLGLRVSMTTDRTWGDSGLERKGAESVGATLKKIGKRGQIDAELDRSGRWQLKVPAANGATMVISGRLHRNEVSTAFEPAEEEVA